MPSFVDSKGRHWEVRITPYTMRQVKEFAGVNLGTILHNNMEPLGKLLSDPVDVCSVIYAICRNEADRKQIDIKEFMEGLVGDPIESAVQALLEGLQQCFPTQQAAMLSAVLAARQQKMSQTKKQTKELLNTLTFITSRSRWQRLLAWIRGTIPASN